METKNNLKDYNVVRRSRYYTIINNKLSCRCSECGHETFKLHDAPFSFF